ncbi:MAG TPA: glycosyl hydrolase [Bryobacteraceae bacterium]|nr:glycosyl hydrolase [Bryobacteraceae bacterium]
MHRTIGFFCLAASAVTAWVVSAQNVDPLARGFLDPPESARPRVWWHWMNGNISKEGIKLDLEWMKRVGIGGFQNFDASLNTPQVVDHRLVYMTPEWKDAFRYAATLADQLGLEMAIAGSPGWSETGGPWVKPGQAMKKLVWSETRVEGGKPFAGSLAQPPTVTGPYQDIPRGGATTSFYADAAVIAYRAPAGDQPLVPSNITTSGTRMDSSALARGDGENVLFLPATDSKDGSWMQFEFAQPQRVAAVTLAASALGTRDLSMSDDGAEFQVVASIPNGGAVPRTVSFRPVSARYFRVAFHSAPPPGGGTPTFAGPQVRLTQLSLYAGARVNRAEEKAAFATAPDLYAFPTPPIDYAILKQDVIDLTAQMHPGSVLDWTPPAGHWVVLRMGYSLTGARNSPASPEATGLEVDKLNRADVKAYMEHYLDLYQETLGPLMGKRGLQYVITDSWEAGVANWTDNMIADFTRRRGYDPRPFMPVLTGRIVENAEASDRFLWDFRKTIGELTAENHYDQLTDLLHARGMGRYSESHESGRAFIGDGMEVKRRADIPMSAMWTQLPGQNNEQFGYNADIRESASVAHIYGQNLVAAESLTAARGPWSWSPETLKPTADKELAMGLNRFVIHTSVHQPLVGKAPGLGLGPFGQWFTRNETWAEMAKPWVTYLARSSYLLQQGRFVADVLYYYGEDSNLTAEFGAKSPDVPPGYNFDYINADALIHQTAVVNGEIVTPSHMRYRVLALDPYSRHMSLPVLRKIRDLVMAGAVVAGPKPTDDPSLSDNAQEFRTLADQVWGSGEGEHACGKGTAYNGPVLAETQAALKAPPDFDYTKPQPDTSLLFVHRTLPGTEIYWVDHRNSRLDTVDATFRVKGMVPELWHADTGLREPVTYRIEGERTIVNLPLTAWEAVFVVFRPGSATSLTVPVALQSEIGTVQGPWTIRFQPGRGAPDSLTLPALSSWHESSDLGVRYFSGTGTYTNSIQAPADWFPKGARLWIDLGDVKNVAEVSLNGKALGTVWHPPFRLEVTGALKPGVNTLEIRVANLWVNRLVGDAQKDVKTKYTLTTQPFYQASSPLLPSGLLGPVTLWRE